MEGAWDPQEYGLANLHREAEMPGEAFSLESGRTLPASRLAPVPGRLEP